jgi:hypothetical protein
MEENTEQIPEQAEEVQWEQLPWNKHDTYIPTEFQVIDYQRSWKKCHCGRQTWMNDNYCPSCGQKLGMPNIYDD